jgi:hypothetical protein
MVIIFPIFWNILKILLFMPILFPQILKSSELMPLNSLFKEVALFYF